MPVPRATLAIAPPRIETLALRDLASVPLTLQSTLIVPPARRMLSNALVKSKLDALEQQFRAA